MRLDEIDRRILTALQEDATILGLSVLSGAHLEIAQQVRVELDRQGMGHELPVVLGGIVPEGDVDTLHGLGIRAVFTPKDFDLLDVMDRILDVIGAPAVAPSRAAGA